MHFLDGTVKSMLDALQYFEMICNELGYEFLLRIYNVACMSHCLNVSFDDCDTALCSAPAQLQLGRGSIAQAGSGKSCRRSMEIELALRDASADGADTANVHLFPLGAWTYILACPYRIARHFESYGRDSLDLFVDQVRSTTAVVTDVGRGHGAARTHCVRCALSAAVVPAVLMLLMLGRHFLRDTAWTAVGNDVPIERVDPLCCSAWR